MVGPDQALRAVTAPGFDPSRVVVVEGDPGLGPSPAAGSGPPGEVSYAQLGTQSARMEVVAPAPAVVLVRVPFDPNWHASVDGKPGRILPADDLDMGIAVPPGRHVVTLAYDDPWIGYGLLGSVFGVTLLGAAFVVLRRRVPPAALSAARSAA